MKYAFGFLAGSGATFLVASYRVNRYARLLREALDLHAAFLIREPDVQRLLGEE